MFKKSEGNIKNEEQTRILFNADDYLELVDYTGRIVKKGKCGAIDPLTPPILNWLNLNTEEWLARSCAFAKKLSPVFC